MPLLLLTYAYNFWAMNDYQEFNSLCLCLTMERLSDNPDFTHWSVSQGRLDSFEMIRSIISPTGLQKAPIVHSSRCGDRSSGLLCMLAMGLAYQVEMQEKERGSVRTGAAIREVSFDGSILLADNVTLDSISRHQLPSIVVTDPITNYLYGQDRPVASSSSMTAENIAIEYDHTVERRRTNLQESSPRENFAIPQAAAIDLGIPRCDASRGEISCSSSVISSNGRDLPNVQSTVSLIPLPIQQPKVAPVAWTVETEPMGGKERENARAREVRASKRMSLGQIRTAGILSGCKFDSENRSDEATDATSYAPMHQSSPKSIAPKLRRDSTNSNGSKQESVSDTKQPQQEISEMQSTLVFESQCPLRCVCLLRDSMEGHAPSSSSWMFALGSNDKSVKVARVTDMPLNQHPSVEILRDFSDVHRGSIYAMDWSSNISGHGQGQGGGGLLATASNDKSVRILK